MSDTAYAARGRAAAPAWAGALATWLLAAAFAARIGEGYWRTPLQWQAAGLTAGFLAVLAGAFAAQRWLGRWGHWPNHACLALEAALVLWLQFLPPRPDYVTALFVAISLQAALTLPGRALAPWTAGLMALIVGSLVYLLGWARGLALASLPAAGCVILPAFVLALREVEAARAESEALLAALRAAHARLEAYSAQVEELAALEERNRLARELHDSVSQTIFSLSLNARAARAYLERDPIDSLRLRALLERLEVLAAAALAEVRSLIERFRPAGGRSG
jgi:signal transduction histidine kinase